MAAMHGTVEPTRIVVIARTVALDHGRVKKARCPIRRVLAGARSVGPNRSGRPIDACRPVDARTPRADCPRIMTAI